MCLAEDVGCRVDVDAVVQELVVNVVRHARAVTAAVQTAVSGDCLSASHRGRDRDTVRVAVKDHNGMTCPGAGSVDFKPDIAAASVSVRIGAASDSALVWRVDGSAAVTPHIPAGVRTGTP